MVLARISFAAIAVASLAGSASAAYISAEFLNVGPGVTVQFSTDGGSNWSGNVGCGALNFKRTGGTTNDTYFGNVGDTYKTFCIDLQKQVNPGSTYDWQQSALKDAPTPPGDSNHPMGQAKATLIGELWARHRSALTSNDDYAAFQMAIWEIVFEDTTTSPRDVTTGNFRIQNAAGAMSMANTWLGELDGSQFYGGLYAITSTTNGNPQDQLVPTPGSIVLAGLGGMVLNRRRR